MSEVARLHATVTLDDARFQQGVRRVNDGLHKMARSGRDVTASLQSIGTTLSLGVSAPLAALGVVAFRSAMHFDSLKRGLTAVAGSSAAAEQQLTRLKEIAKLPGLAFEDAIEGSIRLQAAGVSAQMAERALKAFGNALATVGKGKAELEGVNVALSQIFSKGVVSAEEIHQLAERVPQIRQIMIRALGTANTEIIQAAGITSQQFFDAIIPELERMPKVAEGPQTAWENAMDNIKQSLVKIGDAILPVVDKVLKDLIPTLERGAEWFSNLDKEGQQFLVWCGAAVIALGPVITTLTQMATLLGGIGRVLGAAGGWLGLGGAGAAAAAGGAGTAGAEVAAGAVAAGGLRGAAGGALPFLGRTVPLVMKQDSGALPNAIIDWLHLPKDWKRRQEPPSARDGSGKSYNPAGSPSGSDYYNLPGKSPEKAPTAKEVAAQTEARQLIEAQFRKAALKAASAQREAGFRSLLAQAQAGAVGGPENAEARRSLAIIGPILQQRELGLLEDLTNQEKGSKDYFDAEREVWTNRREMAELQSAAQKEIADEQKRQAEELKKRGEDALRIQDAAYSTQLEAAEATGGNVLQVMAERMKQLVERARSLATNTAEYWGTVKDYWSTQGQINQIRKRQAEEEARAQKKALDDAREASEYQKNLAEARVSLAEAQLGNSLGLSDQQRKAGLLPSLLGQYSELQQSYAGETELARLQRATQAEGVRGKVMEALGLKGGLRQVLGGLVYAGGRMGGAADRLTQVVINLPPGSSIDKIAYVVQQELNKLTRGAAPAAAY